MPSRLATKSGSVTGFNDGFLELFGLVAVWSTAHFGEDFLAICIGNDNAGRTFTFSHGGREFVEVFVLGFDFDNDDLIAGNRGFDGLVVGICAADALRAIWKGVVLIENKSNELAGLRGRGLGCFQAPLTEIRRGESGDREQCEQHQSLHFHDMMGRGSTRGVKKEIVIRPDENL